MFGLPNAAAEGRCAVFDLWPPRWRAPVIIDQDDGPGRQCICGACLVSPRGARVEPPQQPRSVSAEGRIRTDACSLLSVALLDAGVRKTTGQWCLRSRSGNYFALKRAEIDLLIVRL